ncbi:CheW domain-containing protein [Phytopseudomonas dryadis]|uniref:Chemotaxis protein CheW n=1 Tax=Phytopseudomonas dryadis TaxID=2487520 RepID=A0A4Q9R4K9_9GAMM|nr:MULTISPECIES: CheW domain-containing protein [Pseudomonas]TBU95369.1 chemotaxis protein CheW [Pseudomonas dryadis]TBV08204.1 chemotaxis protein CheW [Pseudomonas dryadis]TBV19794.1 chemotaxis protein CheW [Pseudomonas sp. FRB 230]
MSRSIVTATRPQLALQSYLDGLLQEAAVELELELAPSSTLDEFEAAVREEQIRDAQLAVEVGQAPQALSEPVPVAPAEPAPEIAVEAVAMPALVEAVAEVHRPAPPAPSVAADGRPEWAQEPFECLLFDVAGLTLAVPLVCLGSIYPLAGQELTPLFGQPDWFLGILPSQSGNLKVLDTARWVMPDRYREDFRQGLQYVISVQGYEWGLAVHQVSRSIRLEPDEIKWRGQRAQRPWLAGTVIEHMCALLDVAALAELIASGATRRMAGRPLH